MKNDLYNFIERLSNLMRIDSRQTTADHGLQPVQLEVLHYLALCNQFSDTPMAVTEYLGQTKGTVSQTIKVLEKKQLISKQGDVNDKRMTHLKLTEKGGNILENSIPTQAFIKACDSIDDDSKAIITASLNQLLHAMLASNNMKSFGVCRTCHFHKKNTDTSYYCDLVKKPLEKFEIELICREHRS